MAKLKDKGGEPSRRCKKETRREGLSRGHGDDPEYDTQAARNKKKEIES
jgi:hypothetical protein